MNFISIMSKKKSLLNELNSLGYCDRIKKIILLSKNMKKDDYKKLLLSLLDNGQYEANLSLAGASVIRDCEIIKKALVHNKNSIRIKAAKFLAKYGSVEDIESEIDNLSYECRKIVLNTIYSSDNREAAEKLFPIMYSKYGIQESRKIFPLCSHETVEKYIDEIGYAICHWDKIAMYHKEIFMKYFKKTLELKNSRELTYAWYEFLDGVKVLINSNAEFILDCAIDYPSEDRMYCILSDMFGILAKKNSSKVFKILLSEECRYNLLLYGMPKCILKKKDCYKVEQIIEVGKVLKDKYNHITSILHSISPSLREKFFYGVYDKDEINKRIFDIQLLKELPHEVRIEIAKNMIRIRDVVNDKYKYMNVLSCCDSEFSREILLKEAKASKAEERGFALAMITRGASLSGKEVSSTLAYLCKIKNDQDPVRNEVLRELSNYNAALFKDEDVKSLNIISSNVLEARDTSYATLEYLGKLSFNILKDNIEKDNSGLLKFSFKTLLSISTKRGTLCLYDLHGIKKKYKNKIFKEFYPFLKKSNEREDYSCTIKMASLLNKDGYEIVKLQELLKEAVMCKSTSYSKQAAKYYLACKKARDERVRELLEEDKSFICVEEVFIHLHKRRQEWLDLYIKENIIKGKFLSGKTIYLIPAVDGFFRYLPYQQEMFGNMLKSVADNNEYTYYERNTAIHALAKMPDINFKFFDSLLRFGDISIKESVLHAISTTEEPENAIKVLLNNIDGDKARVSMYSVSRCLRNIEPKLVSEAINKLFKGEKLKITVKKEAIRLLGEYKNKQNIKLLIEESQKDNIHKDVQIAIGSSIIKYLDYDFAWDVLKKIVNINESNAVRSLLCNYPNTIAPKHRSNYLKLIVQIASSYDNEIVKEALTAMKSWVSIDFKIIADFAYNIIIDLNDISKWKQALDLLLYEASFGDISEYLINITRCMVNTKISDNINAQAERDMPHRQRLNLLIHNLTYLNKKIRKELIPSFEEMVKIIENDETLVKMCIKLYASCIDFDNHVETIKYINYISEIMKKRPYIIEFAYNEILQRLKNLNKNYNKENLFKEIDSIISQGIDESIYLSLALLEAVGNDLLWEKECSNRLILFRNNSNIIISSKALDIWTCIE